MSRINDKIQEIEKYLSELESILPPTFRNYHTNFEKRAECERYFEKIIEAAVDLAFLVIKEKGLKIPESDKGAFEILARGKIISDKLSTKLKAAKGMRNIIAHEYGKVDDEIVFRSITDELLQDIKELIEHI